MVLLLPIIFTTIWFSKLSTLDVPDEGDSRNVFCAINLISTFLYSIQKESKISNIFYEEFEDTKGLIRIRILKKNRQRNGQKKKYKRTNNDLPNIHIKLKIE